MRELRCDVILNDLQMQLAGEATGPLAEMRNNSFTAPSV